MYSDPKSVIIYNGWVRAYLLESMAALNSDKDYT
jgi:hypothetical protein